MKKFCKHSGPSQMKILLRPSSSRPSLMVYIHILILEDISNGSITVNAIQPYIYTKKAKQIYSTKC